MGASPRGSNRTEKSSSGQTTERYNKGIVLQEETMVRLPVDDRAQEQGGEGHNENAYEYHRVDRGGTRESLTQRKTEVSPRLPLPSSHLLLRRGIVTHRPYVTYSLLLESLLVLA